MKHTEKTDSSINLIDDAFDLLEPFYNKGEVMYIGADMYIEELKLKSNELKSLILDEIRVEFWETCTDFDRILPLRQVYMVRFSKLLNWKNDINDIGALILSLRQDLTLFIDNHKSKNEEFTELEEKTIHHWYLRISVTLYKLKSKLEFYLREWEAMAKNSNNGLIDATPIEEPSKNKDFTTKRQVLAMYYLLNEVGCKTGSVDRTVQGRFIEFLTGKNYDRIYKTLSEPFKGLEITKNTSAKQDMQYIKDQFNNLGLNQIVNKITRDMNI